MESIKSDLAKLDDAIAGKEIYIKRKQEMMNSVLTDEIKQQIKDIEEEFKPDIEQWDNIINELKEKIKADVIAHGETVKGEHMKATFVKGRVKWDAKALEGYAASHPEILQFRSYNQPTIRFGNV